MPSSRSPPAVSCWLAGGAAVAPGGGGFTSSAASVLRVEPVTGVCAAGGGRPAVGRELSGGDSVQANQPAFLGRAFGQLIEERLGHVHVTLTADGGGHDRDDRRPGGETERQVQSAGDWLLDQLREERPAGDVRGLAGGQVLEGSGWAKQFLDGGGSEERGEQAAGRGPAGDQRGGGGAGARRDQPAVQVAGKPRGEPQRDDG